MATDQGQIPLECIDHFPKGTNLTPSPVIYQNKMFFAQDIIFEEQESYIQLPSRYFDFEPNTKTILDAVRNRDNQCNIFNPKYKNLDFRPKRLLIRQNMQNIGQIVDLSDDDLSY